MKKIFSIILAVALLSVHALQTSAQSGLGGLQFGNYQITSIVPTSFTSIDGTVRLTVSDNPYGRISLSEISGIIYHHGNAFIIGSADDLVIPAGKGTIDIKGHVCLESTQALLGVLRNPSIDPMDYSADIKATIKIKGKTVVIEKQNLPLSRILKK